MQNVTIAGAQYSDVPAIELQKTGGGTALFVDVSDTSATAADVRSGKTIYIADGSKTNGSYVYSSLGDNAEFIRETYNYQVALKNTSYNGWTPSTTAKTIVSAKNADTFTADMENYEYLLRWRFTYNPVYAEGTTLLAAPEKEYSEIWQAIIKRPSNLTNMAEANFNGNTCVTLFTAPILVYFKTDGTRTYTFSTSYGVYPTVTAATFSNSTSNTPTVTIKSPAITARCSATYFSTEMAGAVEQDDSIVKVKGEFYRAKTGTLARYVYGHLVDIYNNGLTIV